MGNIIDEEILSEEQIYRRSDRINQSLIKDVIKNVSRREDDSPTEEMNDGTVVDCLITTPHLFDDKYVVEDLAFPEPQIKKVIDMVFEKAIFDNLDFNREEIISCFRQVSNQKWKEDTVVKNVKEAGEAYWDALWNHRGKIILSNEQHNKYQSVVHSFKNKKLSHYFIADGLVEEIKYQLPIYFDFELDGILFECKILLDMVRFNYQSRTIRMMDVKTTQGSTKYWPFLAKKLRPDIQAAFGVEALKWAYPDWTIENPVFLVESINFPGKPRDFVAADIDLHTGKYGTSIWRGYAVLDTDEDGNLLTAEEIEKRELGFVDGLRVLHQAKQLGLSDYDVDYYHHVKGDKPYELNVFVQ